jgi:hypothetical protein
MWTSALPQIDFGLADKRRIDIRLPSVRWWLRLVRRTAAPAHEHDHKAAPTRKGTHTRTSKRMRVNAAAGQQRICRAATCYSAAANFVGPPRSCQAVSSGRQVYRPRVCARCGRSRKHIIMSSPFGTRVRTLGAHHGMPSLRESYGAPLQVGSGGIVSCHTIRPCRLRHCFLQVFC